MITAYLIISSISLGWFAGYVWAAGEKWNALEFLGVFMLCVAWPYLAFVLFKMWREGKL